MNLSWGQQRREFASVNGPILSELSLTGKIYISFDDSRDAQRAMDKIRVLYPVWRVTALTPKEYAWHSHTRQAAEVSDYEGQIRFSVCKDGNNVPCQWAQLLTRLKEVAGDCGDIKLFEPIHRNKNDMFEFRAEFFNIRDAENAVRILDGSLVQVSTITLIAPCIDS